MFEGNCSSSDFRGAVVLFRDSVQLRTGRQILRRATDACLAPNQAVSGSNGLGTPSAIGRYRQRATAAMLTNGAGHAPQAQIDHESAVRLRDETPLRTPIRVLVRQWSDAHLPLRRIRPRKHELARRPCSSRISLCQGLDRPGILGTQGTCVSNWLRTTAIAAPSGIGHQETTTMHTVPRSLLQPEYAWSRNLARARSEFIAVRSHVPALPHPKRLSLRCRTVSGPCVTDQ